VTPTSKLLLGGAAAVGAASLVAVAMRKSQTAPTAAAAPPKPAADPNAMVSTMDQPEWKEGYVRGAASQGHEVEASAVDAENPYRAHPALQRKAWRDGFWSGYRGTFIWSAQVMENWDAEPITGAGDDYKPGPLAIGIDAAWMGCLAAIPVGGALYLAGKKDLGKKVATVGAVMGLGVPAAMVAVGVAVYIGSGYFDPRAKP